jgi:CRP-like cAMP-binding protein
MPNAQLRRLAQLPLVRGADRRELELFERLSTTIEVAKEQVLCSQGVEGRQFFVLLSGRAAVMRDGQLLAVLGPGDWFGEMALCSPHGRRNATVTAVTDASVLVMDREAFVVFLNTCPVASERIGREVEARRRSSAETVSGP